MMLRELPQRTPESVELVLSYTHQARQFSGFILFSDLNSVMFNTETSTQRWSLKVCSGSRVEQAERVHRVQLVQKTDSER